MKEILETLKKACGVYLGEGINHEGQTFTGRLSLEPLLAGRGFQINFSATEKDGKLYHQEASTIAPAMTEKLTLWNFNTNTPGLVPHELRSASAKPSAISSLVFGFNSPQDDKAFREEVALDIWDSNSISYTYSWGMPGGEFKERSGVRMTKTTASMVFGQLHHLEYYVNDLRRSNEFWGWFMPMMGYSKFQEFSDGISWAHENGTYIVFVQVNDKFLSANNSRQGNGLNHIALMGKSNSHLDELQAELERRNIKILKRRADYLWFEDPNDLAVEIYSS
jgi:hypothetical protein